MKKTRSRSTKRTTARLSTKETRWLENYFRERDDFFVKHRYSRVLIGIFLVSFAVFIGVFYWAKMQTAIGYAIYEDGDTYYQN